MKQSIIINPQQSLLEERPMPTIGPEDVLVKVKMCGVCASELHGWKGDSGPYPREYGHEVAGEVAEVGSLVKNIEPGMRVTGLFSKGFAEYARTHQDYVTGIPENVSYEESLGEPIACIISGARRSKVELGDKVALVGLGFMGLLMLQVIHLQGAKQITAIDPRIEALEMARKFGADEIYTPDQIPETFKMTQWSQLGKQHGFNVVFENSGTQAGLTLAGQLTREHGILSLVGWHQGGLRQVDVELWNWKAIDVVNAHERRMNYLMDCMRRGLGLLEAGKIDTASLVSHQFKLDEVDRAFQALEKKPAGFVKAVVTM